MSEQGNGWDKYQALVLDKLDTMKEQIRGLDEKHDKLQENFIRLETEARNAKWVGNLFLPGGVAVLGTWVARKLGL